MARIRSLKPDFWTDSKVVRLSAYARLLFAGSWNFALCDNGHLDDDSFALKLKVLPADPVDADELLAEIVATGMIVRESLPDGRSFLRIVNLPRHSKVDARWQARCAYCAAIKEAANADPPASFGEDAGETVSPADPPPTSPQGGFGFGLGEDGLGGEPAASPAVTTHPPGPDPEPPRKCPRHERSRDSPACGACADARHQHEAWQRRQRDRPTPTPGRPECPVHPGQPTGSVECPICRARDRPAPPGLRAAVRKPTTTTRTA